MSISRLYDYFNKPITEKALNRARLGMLGLFSATQIKSAWDSGALSTSLESARVLWGKSKIFLRSIEPYQPMAASLGILGKIFWKERQYKELNQRIYTLQRRINLLTSLNNNGRKTNPARLEQLKAELRDLKHEREISCLAALQLGCLLFRHPGSNLWNSAVSLSMRASSLHHEINSPPEKKWNDLPYKTLGKIALHSLAIFATTLAIFKQLEITDGDTPFFHGVIGASLVGLGIETLSTGISFLQEKLPQIRLFS